MENDQRLTPLPLTQDLQTPSHGEYAGGYAVSYDDTLDSKRSIRHYFNIVYKRLPIILAITVLATAVVSLYSYRQPSIYEATTGMIIEPRKAPQTKKESININFGDDTKYYNTQLQLLQNVDLMKRVVISLGLQRDANLFSDSNRGILAGLRSLFSGGQKSSDPSNSLPVVSDQSSDPDKPAQIQLTPEENARAENYANTLMNGLKVAQVDRTNIVNVTVETTNSALAPKVSDKVAELFMKEDMERETAGAQKAYEDLGKSIEELKGTIYNQENDLVTALKNSNLSTLDKGSELRAGNLEGLLGQWRDAQNETSKLQAAYTAALNASKNGDVMTVAPNNKGLEDEQAQNLRHKDDLRKRVEEIQKKIDAATEKKQELLATKTEQHRDVITVTAQIGELESQKARVNKEVSEEMVTSDKKFKSKADTQVLAGLRAQLGAAQQREAGLKAEFDRASARANVEGVTETKLTSLKREIEQNRSLLDTYVQRQKEQELALSTDQPNNIKIQNHAVAPGGPIGPQRGRNILVAFLLSLAAGIGLAFLMDYLDDSVRTSDDVSRHLGLPTLALIPHYLNNEKRKMLGAKNGSAAPANQSTALITMDERHSPMAEAYRHLRTSLLFSSAGKPPQTILITSSQPSEGKTTTAINTAITLAQSDAEVIIVDCDLRRPRLHTHFGFENTSGLTNYLSGDKNTENLIRSYPDLPRLKVITSGPIPPNPAELLSSNEMRNLLQFLSGKYKHVIIDSPPAISFTDASILSTLVDGVVLVAMANKSSIHLMRQFKQRIHNIGARIYGVVLNGITSGSMEYDYYGTGYYKYYSKSEEDESTPMMETKV